MIPVMHDTRNVADINTKQTNKQPSLMPVSLEKMYTVISEK
jgi:hypothetical protein